MWGMERTRANGPTSSRELERFERSGRGDSTPPVARGDGLDAASSVFKYLTSDLTGFRYPRSASAVSDGDLGNEEGFTNL